MIIHACRYQPPRGRQHATGQASPAPSTKSRIWPAGPTAEQGMCAPVVHDQNTLSDR